MVGPPRGTRRLLLGPRATAQVRRRGGVRWRLAPGIAVSSCTQPRPRRPVSFQACSDGLLRRGDGEGVGSDVPWVACVHRVPDACCPWPASYGCVIVSCPQAAPSRMLPDPTGASWPASRRPPIRVAGFRPGRVHRMFTTGRFIVYHNPALWTPPSSGATPKNPGVFSRQPPPGRPRDMATAAVYGIVVTYVVTIGYYNTIITEAL